MGLTVHQHRLTVPLICVVAGLFVIGASAIQAFYPSRAVSPEKALLQRAPQHASARRLVLVLVDGLRHDVAFAPGVMPFLNQQKARGAWGIGTNVNLTLTNLAVTNIGTGAQPKITKVLQNFKNSPVQHLSLFTILRRHKLKVALIGDANFGELFGHDATLVAINKDKGRDDLAESDDISMTRALSVLRGRRYALTTIHFVGVDHAGHKFTAVHPAYRRYAKRTDGLIARLRQADPQATFLVLADHGMTDQGTHGGGEPECTRFPLVFFGPGIAKTRLRNVTLDDLAPTILALFGVPDLGSARGRLLHELLSVPETAKLALLRRYHQARRHYLQTLARKYGLPAPPAPATVPSGASIAARLKAVDASNERLNRYIATVVEDTSRLRHVTLAALLLLACIAFLGVTSAPAQAPTPGQLAAVAITALIAVALSLFGQTTGALATLALALLFAAAVLLRSQDGALRRLSSALAFVVALGGLLYGASALFEQFKSQRGLTGWITYLPDLDRWIMPRLKGMFLAGSGAFAVFLALAQRRGWRLDQGLPFGVGVLAGLAMVISVFYWSGNNMARLAMIAGAYAIWIVIDTLRQGARRRETMLAAAISAGVVGLWFIGATTNSWSITFESTYPGWFVASIAGMLIYIALVGRRSWLDGPRGATLLVIAVVMCLGHLYRLFQVQWMPLWVLAGGITSLALVAATFSRADAHRLLPLVLLALYRILAQDVQMGVMVLGMLIIAGWSHLRREGLDRRQAMLTAVWIVSLNLLIFFSSGHFWNFSRVEVAVAFIGKPNEINVVWAGCLLFLKYGVPWLLILNGLLSSTAADEVVDTPVVLAVMFLYVVMITGLLIPFETLKQHLEVGSKALPTAVFTYIHSALMLVALLIVGLCARFAAWTTAAVHPSKGHPG